jgi:hypothetical protein
MNNFLIYDPYFDKKYRLKMNEEKLNFKNRALLCPKYSSLRIAHFIHHQKTPSLEVGVSHQFSFGVNQFRSLWCVDLSQ